MEGGDSFPAFNAITAWRKARRRACQCAAAGGLAQSCPNSSSDRHTVVWICSTMRMVIGQDQG
jgi:hypothetical protein